MTDLTVAVGDRTLEATWTDDAIRWGDELYISASLDAPPENAREVVPEGAVAYWSEGDKLCLFWGPTPASTGDEPRAAAPVTVVARLEETDPLESLEGGARLRLE